MNFPDRIEVFSKRAFVQTALKMQKYIGWLFVGGILLLWFGDYAAKQWKALFYMPGMVFISLCVASVGLASWGKIQKKQMLKQVSGLLAHDPSACFLADDQGVILYCNDVARKGGRAWQQCGMQDIIQPYFADADASLFRLQRHALKKQDAFENIAVEGGQIRLSVALACEKWFLWRLDRTYYMKQPADLGVPFVSFDQGGRVTFANQAMKDMLGILPDHISQFLGEYAPETGKIIKIQNKCGETSVTCYEILINGWECQIILIPIQAGLFVTQPLERSSASDFENVPVALLKITADGLLHQANASARGLLGLSSGDHPAFHDLFEGLGRSVSDWILDIISQRIPVSSEVLRLRRPETDIFYQITLRRILEHDTPMVLAVLNDATALKTLEAQFVQSQKMQAIGQLAGGIAHDFNNLLTAISGHCDLLLLERDDKDPEYNDLMQIHENSSRAASLIRQLLAFSRKQTLQPEELDLNVVLESLTSLLSRLVSERVHLQFMHGPSIGNIRADKRQLEQVIMNLVVNARDAMPNGGTIKIETEGVVLNAPMQRDRAIVPAGRYAVIHVSDSGVGIAHHQQQKVFEPFYTTKKVGEGTGLGLSTAYGIIKQSGGYIFLDSEVGKGTQFHIYLPSYDGTHILTQQAGAIPHKIAVPKNSQGVVLLVEDEAPVRAFALRALQLRGYEVHAVESGEAALHVLADPALKIDLFVTDVVMPGLDGPSWVRKALETRPAVPVVFVSGYAEDCFSEHKSRIPNSVFLAKPFSLSALAEMVDQQMKLVTHEAL